MGWLSRKDGAPSAAAPSAKAGPESSLLRLFGDGTDPDYPASSYANHVHEGFEKNELVFACIQEKATSAPEAPVRVYAQNGRRGEPLDTHPLRLLLENPNPLMTEFELFEMLHQHLDLAGNAFWEIVSDRAGRPAELWPLQPHRVRMKRSRSSVAYGYATGDGSVVPVDVVHFRLTNPTDGLVGTPPMRAALRATALDNEANDFVKTLLQNYAMPGVIIKMTELEDVLDEATTNRLKTKWKQSFGGRNRGEPGFLQVGMDAQSVGLNLRDLEFPDLRTIAESRICMAFGVPPILVGAKVGLDRSTFANYAEARRSFWEETLMPLQRRIRDTIAMQLLPRMGDRRRVVLRHDTSEVLALQESEVSRWTRATEGLRAGGMTLNDWRREVGLPEVSGGDTFLVPSGVIATRDVSGVTAQLTSTGSPLDDANAIKILVDAAAALIRSGFDPVGALEAVGLDPIKHLGLLPVTVQKPAEPEAVDQETVDALKALGYHVAADGTLVLEAKARGNEQRTVAEAKYSAALEKYFADRQRDVEAQIGGKARGIDRDRWNGILAGTLKTLDSATATAAGKGVSSSYDPEQVAAWHQIHAAKQAEDINAALILASRAALVEAEPAVAVADLFAERRGSGAAQMAVGMATAMISRGRSEAGKQARGDGRSVTKTWITTSSNPRATHAAMNGETVGIDDVFSNGMKFPGDAVAGADEVAGCQCDVEITIEEG